MGYAPIHETNSLHIPTQSQFVTASVQLQNDLVQGITTW